MKRFKKWCCFLLSLCMILALFPAMTSPVNAANASAKYKDVVQTAWYVPYIDYVVEHGLMTGNSSTSFAPNGTVTRAQYIQTLYALAKKPSVKETTKFTDLKKGAYYIDAVSWAAENKVTGGMTPTTFGPNIAITREQAATFFYAYAKQIAGLSPKESKDLSTYPDNNAVSAFAVMSMKWAVGAQLISGYKQKNSVLLYPRGILTRAQLATMLKAFDEYLKNNAEGLKKPDNPTEVDEYYWSNSKVMDVVKVKESKDTLTDKQAVSLLENRGFDDYIVISDCTMEGEIIDEAEIEKTSSAKHPMYETYYTSKTGEIWTIFIINGKVYANPVSFNLESDLGAQLLLSEDDMLTSYDDTSNQYYVTKPNRSAIILKTVEKIDANTLDTITSEELRKS